MFNLPKLKILKLVPQAGIEPARRLGREILSLLCLPISPPRHDSFLNFFKELNSALNFVLRFVFNVVIVAYFLVFIESFTNFFHIIYSTLTNLKYSKINPHILKYFKLARPAGFEPATYRLEGGCSIQLS